MIKRKDTEKRKLMETTVNEYFHFGGVLTTQYFTLVCKNPVLYTSFAEWKVKGTQSLATS